MPIGFSPQRARGLALVQRESIEAIAAKRVVAVNTASGQLRKLICNTDAKRLSDLSQKLQSLPCGMDGDHSPF